MSDLAKHTEKFYYFYEVTKSGSLQACSRNLGISTPTLSYSIKKLEEIIGTELFVRSKKGMQLNQAGEELLVFCQKYFRELEDLQQKIINPQNLHTIKLRIGTFQSIAIYLWPLILDTIKGYPHLSMTMKTDRSSNIQEALFKRDIDLAITVEGQSHPDIICHEIYCDKYAIYGSVNVKASKLKIEDIQQKAIIFMPEALDQNGISLTNHLRSWPFKFKEEFELDSFEVIAEFIKRDYGLGILPMRVAASYQNELQAIEIEGLKKHQFGPHRFFMSYRADLNLPQKLITLFLEAAKQASEEINYGR